MKSVLSEEMDRNIGFLVTDISRLITAEYNRMISPLGLTRAQWRVIVYLLRTDGQSQVELARLLGIGKVAVGGLVARLEKNGWVKRKVDSADRRTNRVYLTAKGRSIETDLIKTGHKLTELTWGELSEQDRGQLTQLLQTVKQNLLNIEARRLEKV